MSAYTGTLVIDGMAAVMGTGRSGPLGGSTTSGVQRLQKLVGPSISWERLGLLVAFLLALALMSAVLSTLAWTGSRRNEGVRSSGGHRPH